MRKTLITLVLLCSSNYSLALPPSTDGSLEKLKLTKYEFKQCYQHMTSGGNDGIFSMDVLSGIDRIQGGRRSNTHEFPWENTAGHTGKRYHYYSIPGDIEYTDITAKREGLGNVERVFEWRFPEGTVFAEELLVDDKVFEVRLKRKVEGKWTGIRYNPWIDMNGLVKHLEDCDRVDAWFYAQTLKAPRELSPFTLRTDHDRRPAFKEINADQDDIPFMKKELRDYVLSRKFFPHSDWQKNAATPSTRFEGQIVPLGYTGFAFPSGSQSCMVCHEQTGLHAFQIDSRDWYGRVRGSDGIFSFHIFDESSITDVYGPGKKVTLNPNLKLKRVEKW